MDLKKIIIEGKISDLDQLTRAGQREVAADPELQQLISENEALINVVDDLPPTPNWDYLRYGVVERANDLAAIEQEEQRIEQLPLFHRVNILKPWLAQASAAFALVAIICVLAYFLPSGEETNTDSVRVSRQNVQWCNFALASRSGQYEDENSRRSHP